MRRWRLIRKHQLVCIRRTAELIWLEPARQFAAVRINVQHRGGDIVVGGAG